MAFQLSQQVLKLSASTWEKVDLEDITGEVLIRNQWVNNDGSTECEIWVYLTLDPLFRPTDTSDAIHLSLDQNFVFTLIPDLYLWAYSETGNASLLILQAGREAPTPE
jgi:hypothetical protein